MKRLLLTALSLYYMTDFTPDMDDWLIIMSGVIQGLGLGLVFVSVSVSTHSSRLVQSIVASDILRPTIGRGPFGAWK